MRPSTSSFPKWSLSLPQFSPPNPVWTSLLHNKFSIPSPSRSSFRNPNNIGENSVCVCECVCVCACHITSQVPLYYFEPQEQLNKQISTSETLSRKLNESEAVNSYLNTTIDGLTKTVGELNQTVRWLCGQAKDVSTCKLEAVSTFTEVR